MNKEDWLKLLQERVVLADGAMGTMLYNKGVYLNLCFDEVNLTNPDLVRSIHREYIQAGAEIIETNTFGANRFKLKKYGLEDKVAEINRAAARLAHDEAGKKVWVAGSIGPLGVKIEPWGPTSVEEAEEAFREQVRALVEAGVDLFILETFADLNEIHQAVKAVQKEAPDYLIVSEMTIEEDGNSLYGTSPEVFTRKLDEWGADVIGVNCSVGPAAMLQCLERMAKVTSKPLSAMPNAGVPRNVEGRNIYLCSPEYLAEYGRRFILNGVRLVGGCCGTTPAHIRALRGAIRSMQPAQRSMVIIHEEADENLELPTRPMAEKSSLGKKLSQGHFVVSVEIVPPRGWNAAAPVEVARLLKERGVDCVNIPDGPRASSRLSPIALAFLIQAQAGIEVILHYTCRDRNLLGIQSDLLGIYAQGIRNLLLITGDPPKLGDYPDATAVFDVDSIGLTNVVSYLNRGVDIGKRRLPEPTNFLIGVGANPGAIKLDYELSRFRWKVEAGAEFVITQPVFDVGLLEQFLERIESYRVPILAGVWPLASLRNAEFMHNEVPGARVPAEVMERMRRAQEVSPERAREEGIAIAQEIVLRIKDKVQGIQISPPFGRYEAVLKVLEVL
ncbi:MAG: bifunctional homocysteine S-methyltransferase/methylenetetrahydrofolate reductase [Candidatus Aminicenantales bacterium]